MNKFFFNAFGVTMLVGSFLLANNASATEGYDVKKFGPKSPIIMDEPVNVIFDHRVHTDQIGLECNACHDGLFAMQRGVTPKSDQTMSSLTQGKSCGACHDGETAFASNTLCNACHIRPENLKESDPHPHGDTQGATHGDTHGETH